MKRHLFVLLLTACGSIAPAAAQTTYPACPEPAKASGVLGVLITDFQTACLDYAAAAAAQPADSPLAVTFQAAAVCMAGHVERFSALANTASAPALDNRVAGIVSFGAAIDIDAQVLQAQLASAKASQDAGTAACDQRAGAILRTAATSARTLGREALRRMFGL